MIPPDTRFTHRRGPASKRARRRPIVPLSDSHESAEPRKTPRSRLAGARGSGCDGRTAPRSGPPGPRSRTRSRSHAPGSSSSRRVVSSHRVRYTNRLAAKSQEQGDISVIPATQVKVGMVILHKGEPLRVTSVLHVTPGNWRGMVHAKRSEEH